MAVLSESGHCSATLVFGSETFTLGWRAGTPAQAFGAQIREAVCTATGRQSLAGIDLVAEAGPRGGAAVDAIAAGQRVTPRDVYEGRVSCARIVLPAETDTSSAPGAADVRLAPSAVTNRSTPAPGGYAAGGSVASRAPRAPAPGRATLQPPDAPKGRLLEPPGRAGAGRAFQKKGGSQLQFMALMNANKNVQPPDGVLLTREEVAKRSKASNCWTIYQGKVYDITMYMDFHPGGKEELMKGAGTDMTADFNRIHPWVSFDGMLGKLCLGPLVTAPPPSLAPDAARGDEAGAERGPLWSGLRDFVVVRRRREAQDIITLVVEPAARTDEVFRFLPGQSLGVCLPGHEAMLRSYTLTSRTGERFLEISVKRLGGGWLSPRLHDEVAEGARLRLEAPKGIFTPELLGPRARSGGKVAMLSAGVGITPMIALAEALGASRVLLAAHVDRTESSHAFRQRFKEAGVPVRTHYTSALGRPPRDFAGRLAAELGGDSDWFVCGPASFMSDAVESLEEAGVPPEQIHIESFGRSL
eukprot:TRINITY_DN22750_c0_g3_i1.p1 TRINITY_DN22750_c0_g3~~TRINITY_DN22750_c0_g3_i1.p1  ORF type:complete len:541 (-),score=117.14 TRINITY_DN22750_c0_g3_i1:100-1683(-)